MQPVVKFCYIRPDQDMDIPLPKYMTSSSAGMDICAAIAKDVVIEPGEICLIPTGFAIAVPQNFEAQIRPRSGLAVRHGITLINSPGTIDADYRGEVMLPLINHSKNSYTICRGERVAQMVVNKIYQVNVQLVNQLDKTDRNTGGFGHTGY